MSKLCNLCQVLLPKRNITGLCKKCRVKKWHLEHRTRVNEIKKRYVISHPEERKQSWVKYNHEKKDKRAESNAKWYDKVMFEGKRLILINVHPFCDRCGANDRKLHVHHRDGKGTTSEIKNNSWENLVVLCNSCHKIVHERREQPYVIS